MEVGHVTYAQLTLPSPHRDGGHHHPFNQQHPRGMCGFKRQHKIYLKSVNQQYNTLVRWDARTKDSSTKRLIFQAFFFIISYRFGALKTLYFYYKKIKK